MKNSFKQYRKKTFTVDDILAMKPCAEYNRKDIKELFNCRERLTILEVLDLKIDIANRVWLLLHLFTKKQKKEFGCYYLRKLSKKGVNRQWENKLSYAKDSVDGQYNLAPSKLFFWTAYDEFEEWAGRARCYGHSLFIINYEEISIKHMKKFLTKHGYLKGKK